MSHNNEILNQNSAIPSENEPLSQNSDTEYRFSERYSRAMPGFASADHWSAYLTWHSCTPDARPDATLQVWYRLRVQPPGAGVPGLGIKPGLQRWECGIHNRWNISHQNYKILNQNNEIHKNTTSMWKLRCWCPAFCSSVCVNLRIRRLTDVHKPWTARCDTFFNIISTWYRLMNIMRY